MVRVANPIRPAQVFLSFSQVSPISLSSALSLLLNKSPILCCSSSQPRLSLNLRVFRRNSDNKVPLLSTAVHRGRYKNLSTRAEQTFRVWMVRGSPANPTAASIIIIIFIIILNFVHRHSPATPSTADGTQNPANEPNKNLPRPLFEWPGVVIWV